MAGLNILRTRGTYIGQVRGIGCRNWRQVTGRCRSAPAALAHAVQAMRRNDKRARALFVPNLDWAWYEPHVAMEAVRR